MGKSSPPLGFMQFMFHGGLCSLLCFEAAFKAFASLPFQGCK